MGPIAKQWINEQTKLEILTVIETSQQQGVSVRRSCLILAIEHRRIIRWQHRVRRGQSLANLAPGSQEPLHRMLPGEIDQIIAMAKSQEYVDLSHRIMAVTAWDKGLFQASFSTVYRVLKEQNLMSARGPGGAHNGNSKAPVRKELTGPNQRWCWDISYLMTFQKGVYLYLYLLLDEWSRKAIQWRIGWRQTAEESRLLLEGGLVEQNILDLPEDQRPELINDRGRQMKAKPIRRLCEDHGMPQLFARPRTPNDNPFIESAFSTVKRAHSTPAVSWMTTRPSLISVGTLLGTTPSTIIEASTTSPLSKPTRASDSKSLINDVSKSFLSSAGAEKKTKSKNPAKNNRTKNKH
ncbi:MAG: transposase [Pedosphaera sp.]|nr:transposase [Pedosphaera sp.]